MAGRNPQTIADVLKDGYTPILLGRVSSSGQRKGLPAQMEFLRTQARKMGFKKKPVEHAVQHGAGRRPKRTLVRELHEPTRRRSMSPFPRLHPYRSGLKCAGATPPTLRDGTITLRPARIDRRSRLAPPVDVPLASRTIAERQEHRADSPAGRRRQAAEIGLPEGVPQTLYLTNSRKWMEAHEHPSQLFWPPCD